jgi:hypothetical protein
MERWAANTLRTLGIVLTSILVIVACGILLLFSLCMASLGGSSDRPVALVSLAIAAGVALAGGFTITKLARGVMRESLPAEESPVDAAPAPIDRTKPVAEQPLERPALSQPVVRFDAAHFSPASRAAVRQLKLAVGVYVGVSLLAMVVPVAIPRSLLFYPALTAQLGIMSYTVVYRLVAVVPYVVLLYSLSKYPGPRAFAYSLVVPAIPLLGSIFSIPLLLFALSRMPGHFVVSLLSSLVLAVPAILNFGIAYFGWVAIQKTGIHPPPKRLLIASLVIFLYNSMSGVVSGVLIMVLGGRLLRA